MGIFDRYKDRIDKSLHGLAEDAAEDAADIRKSVDEMTQATNPQNKFRYKRAAIVDPSMSSAMAEGGYGVYKPRYSHISNKTLKEMSLRDPIVSSIIQTRINQVARFSRPQENRYDPGFKILPVDPSMEIKPGSEEEQEIAFLIDYVRNCGSNEQRDPKSKMDFDTFLRLVIRDRLTFAAAAIETIRTPIGSIHSFIPAPTDTIYYANKQLPSEMIEQAVQSQQLAARGAINQGEGEQAMIDLEERERLRGEDDPIEYVQVINGRVDQSFTAKEMLFKLGNPQNFIENNGYCIGELEMATLVITGHLQAENYNKLFFTHGFASRGLLHIQGDVTPANLQAFRSQWHAQIAGNENSWRTPIIAGADNVQWIALSANNRDMEYSNYIDHIIRTLCSLFQISPVEIGFDYLTKGESQGGIGSEDNEVKIEQSQVRGLKPLLVWIETILNEDILPNVSEELAGKYRFSFVGLETESKMEEITRQTSEIQVRATLNDVRRESGLDPVPGGDIVLNPTYLQYLSATHKVGEIREFVFGYKGDAENPEYNYVADPFYFQNLMMITGMMQQQMTAEAGGDPNDPNGGGGDPNDPNAGGGGSPFGGGDAGGGDDQDAGGGGNPFGGGKKDAGGGKKPPAKTGKAPMKKAMQDFWYVKPAIDPGMLKKAQDMGVAHHHFKVKKLDSGLEAIRQEHLNTYKKIAPMMLKEIADALKDDDGSESNDN